LWCAHPAPEPKLKCYLEARVPDYADLVTARADAEKTLATMRAEMSAILGIPAIRSDS
jgi:hypothetical protein